MTVRVVAFARIREILGGGSFQRSVEPGATIETLWESFAREHPVLGELRASTRFARNGAVAPAAQPLRDGDEIALLPPYGGG